MNKNKLFDLYMVHRGKAAIVMSVLIARHIALREKWQFNYLYPLLLFAILYMLFDIIYAAVNKKGEIKGDKILLFAGILVMKWDFDKNMLMINVMVVAVSLVLFSRDVINNFRLNNRNIFRNKTSSAKCVVLNNTSVIIEVGDGIKYVDGKSEYMEIVEAACDAVNGCLEDLNLYVDRYVKKKKNPEITRFLHLFGDEEGNVRIVERDIIDRNLYDSIEKYIRDNGLFQ